MGAKLSSCKKYRYSLSRDTGLLTPDKGIVLFIMLNPSTADAFTEDPTIRRCMGFAKTWGHSGLVVGNLYALRATNPKELWKADNPIGRNNDYWLKQMMSETKDVVCAWGNNAQPDRAREFINIARELYVNLWCLGINKDGSPRHPLYIKADQKLISYKV